MAGKFAERTKVSTEATRSEIEKALKRYGATRFAYMREENVERIAFTAQNRNVVFKLPMPTRQEARFEQESRQRWRALLLAIKAKLECVEVGISSFEDEFLAYIMLPDSQTVGEYSRPRIAALYDGHSVPLLPPPSA